MLQTARNILEMISEFDLVKVSNMVAGLNASILSFSETQKWLYTKNPSQTIFLNEKQKDSLNNFIIMSLKSL